MATQGWADAMLHQPKDFIEVSRLLYDPPPQIGSLSAEERGSRLVQAAERGAVGALRALIAAGADVAARGEWGRTALHWAARREVAAALLDAGADRGSTTGDGRTALDIARQYNRRRLVEMLS
ncbi:ankyrin repeat, SAM and basic leucine zipper domain-containing protein 1-like [Schistocerca nitens]|uniref:ankyrin repeat, SAM and basic leucine zipper domain-containing protein 1-like n=1 Tax=Schistocerca nitens TaxID=7011 RepID=UPI00211856D8|nr:ankyrin repeat, SAM and basic leucine zipper domain-containing protein 1-like [Schistocerca nitens]